LRDRPIVADHQNRPIVQSSSTSPVRPRGPARQRVRAPVELLTSAVFERFPFGLLITDTSSIVLAANPTAGRQLEGTDTGALIHDTCCRLLGCRRLDGPLGGHCLSVLALASAEPLPEVRMDLPVPRSGVTAVWVTAARLSDGAALLQLRPADAGDRRRRTEPHWLNGPALQVRTLGRTSVASAEGSIDGAWLGQLPGQLLKYLVCQRGRVAHADEILTHFWPEGGRGAVVNLRHAVFSLRKKLEPARARHSTSSFVIARDGGYELDRRVIAIDADEFETAAGDGLRAYAAGDPVSAREPLERAAALYRGEFLTDEPYVDWAFVERDRLHEIACNVLRALDVVCREAGDSSAAVQSLIRLAELEPFDGTAQRTLLGLLVDLDRRSEAVRRYRHLRAQWIEAFGEPPDFDVRSLGAAGP
jgi:DNA-binding SARP family transcriptional activator